MIIILLSKFLFKQNDKLTKLDMLIKHLKEEKHFSSPYEWDHINHFKLNEDNSGILLGDDNTYLSFTNDEDIILNIDNKKISLKSKDANIALKELENLIKLKENNEDVKETQEDKNEDFKNWTREHAESNL